MCGTCGTFGTGYMWYIWNRVDVVKVVHEDVIHHITRVTVTLLLVIIWVRLVSLVVSSYCTGKYQQEFVWGVFILASFNTS